MIQVCIKRNHFKEAEVDLDVEGEGEGGDQSVLKMQIRIKDEENIKLIIYSEITA